MIMGEIKKSTLRKIIKYSIDNCIPVMIEVDYDIKRIPENNFKEADELLKYALLE